MSDPIDTIADKCLVGSRNPDRAYQTRDIGQRVVDRRLLTLLDRRHHEHGGRRQRGQNRCAAVRHIMTLTRTARNPQAKIEIWHSSPWSVCGVRRRVSIPVPRAPPLRNTWSMPASPSWTKPMHGRPAAASSRCGRVRWWPGMVARGRSHRRRPHRQPQPARPAPDRVVAGWQVVALQPYGGAWLNCGSTCDSGSAAGLLGAQRNSVEHRLVRVDDPILRVPQLAIHLSEDRKGVTPTRNGTSTRCGAWASGPGRSWLRGRAGRRVAAADAGFGPLLTHDLAPSAVTVQTARSVARAAAGQPGHLLRGPGGLPVMETDDHTRCSRAVRPRGGRFDRPRRSPELLPTVLERIVLAPPAAAGRTTCAGSRGRRWPRATWRTRDASQPILTATSPAIRSPPQRRPGAQGAAQPAVRHRWPHRSGLRWRVRSGCCCSAPATAPTCRAWSTIGP